MSGEGARPSNAEVVADLTRVTALFQARAVASASGFNPAALDWRPFFARHSADPWRQS